MSTSTLIQPEWVKMELCDMGKSIFNDFPLTQDRFDLKKASIETSLALQDYQLLQNLTKTRDGLLTMELRRKVWPVLLGMDEYQGSDSADALDTLPPHRDEDQLRLDIDRSFVYWPSGLAEFEMKKLRSQLESLIARVLRCNPELNYYQGYHDVASVFLLVFQDEDRAFQMLQAFTLLHLRDFMVPEIEFSVDHLQLIPELVMKIDPELGKLIKSIPPFYALSSILTLFAHNFKSLDHVYLVWDFLMCENSMAFPIYLYATILCYYKDVIFEELQELSGCSDKDLQNDSAMTDLKDFLHSVLSNVIDKNLNKTVDKSAFFDILQLSLAYLNKFPPTKLKSFTVKISENSVLKTSSKFDPNLTLDSIHTRVAQYSSHTVHQIFKAQLQEAKKKRELMDLQRSSHRADHKNMNKLLFLTKYLSSSKDNRIKLRNKHLKLSTVIFRVSFAIGVLGFLLKYYNLPITRSFPADGILPAGIQSLPSKLINTNGYNLLNLKFNDFKETLYRFT